jgi:2-iminobutanoate/2-iminopropanoate deaminase
VGKDVASQTRQTLQNVENIVRSAGSCLRHAVKTTVYLADIADFGEMNAVYAEFFPEGPPARATLQAAALPLGARVEIEVIAEACECDADGQNDEQNDKEGCQCHCC